MQRQRLITTSALLILLIACSGGNGGPTDPPGGGPPTNDPPTNDPPTNDPPAGSQQTVQILGSSFDPSMVTVAAGTTVIWRNSGGAGHTVTPQGHNAWQRVETTAAGGEVLRVTLTTPGTYNYLCEPHAASGMTGTITVQ